MLAIDWGTSSLRVYRMAADGGVKETRSAPRGILTVADGNFAGVLEDLAADWLDRDSGPVLLSRMIGSPQGWVEAPPDPPWFRAGLRQAREPGGLLHHLFSVRPRGLLGDIPGDGLASYLSGVLIGHEIAAAMATETEASGMDTPVALIGAAELTGLYGRALAEFGIASTLLPGDLAARGLWRLAAPS